MADPNIPLNSLPTAGSGTINDVTLLRQGSLDKKATLQVLKNVILNNNNFDAATILNFLLTVDGSGSSLDSDLLDGQHGSFYRDASNLNTGTIPSARLSAGDILALLLTVDGSGSGVDADLLDGQQGSFYRNASNINTGTLNLARLPAFSASLTTNGNLELPGGFQIRWGRQALVATANPNIKNFSATISPAFSTVPLICAGLTCVGGRGAAYYTTLTTTNLAGSVDALGFTPNATDVDWLVIGR